MSTEPADPTEAGAQSDELGRRLRAAAAALFEERGYGSATVDEIAERAGVGVGTLYRRWPDKPALANAVFEEVVTAMTELLEVPPRTSSGHERFREGWRRLWDFVQEHPNEFLFVEGNSHEAFVDGANRARKIQLGDIAAARLHEMGISAPPELASAMILGTLVHARRSGFYLDRDETGDRIWQALRG